MPARLRQLTFQRLDDLDANLGRVVGERAVVCLIDEPVGQALAPRAYLLAATQVEQAHVVQYAKRATGGPDRRFWR